MLDVFMEAYAMIVIAALAGAFGAFIQNEAWSWTRRASGTVSPETRRHIV